MICCFADKLKKSVRTFLLGSSQGNKGERREGAIDTLCSFVPSNVE